MRRQHIASRSTFRFAGLRCFCVMTLCYCRGTVESLLGNIHPTAFASIRLKGKYYCGDARRNPSSSSALLAKRKSAKGSSASGKNKRKNRKIGSTSTIGKDAPELSIAAQRPPAALAGVVEDHNYEQFFYDTQTANELFQLVDLYERPLLLCNPTLAVIAERKSKPYKLLDRDTRFDFLDGYEQFSLMEPHLITDYEFDAVFIDPPFANVTPKDVARCLRLIAADDVPLWVAYNSKREKELLKTMNELDCPNLEPKWKLSYKEGVSEDTQDSIWLYGPANFQ